MRRDMSTVRDLLLKLEEGSVKLADAETEYHAKLLVDAHLAIGCDGYYIDGLTWDGRDFVDLCRDPDRWDRVAHKIEEGVGSAPFDVWEDLLRADMMEKLGS